VQNQKVQQDTTVKKMVFEEIPGLFSKKCKIMKPMRRKYGIEWLIL